MYTRLTRVISLYNTRAISRAISEQYYKVFIQCISSYYFSRYYMLFHVLFEVSSAVSLYYLTIYVGVQYSRTVLVHNNVGDRNVRLSSEVNWVNT